LYHKEDAKYTYLFNSIGLDQYLLFHQYITNNYIRRYHIILWQSV